MKPTFQAKTVSCLALTMILGACGSHKKSSPDDTQTSSTGGTVAPTGGAVAAGPAADTLTAASVVEGIGHAGNALQSVGALALNAQALALTQTMAFPSYDDECDPNQSGWPIGYAYSTDFGGDLAYNAAFVKCLMKEPDNSGETMMGALANAAGMVCALSDKLVFDGLAHDITLNITTDCFTQDYVAQLTKLGAQTWTGKVTASTSDFVGNTSGAWDGSVRIQPDVTINGQVQHADFVYLFKMDDANKQYTILQVYGPETSGDVVGLPYSSGFIIGMDMANGVLRYEGRGQGKDSQGTPVGNRHARAYAKGTLGADGKFTALTDSELIYSSLYFYANEADDDASIKTAKGNPSDGIFLNTFEEKGSAYGQASSYQNLVSGCIPGTGACAGNTGIQLATDADYEFLILPSNGGTLEDWYINAAPLSFTDVKPVLVQQ